ncbi:MAG TPA: glycosyltransferase family A protein [Pirellulales bacterium]|nr:glycosyltransferase family A protein [Pirellulales bacterium]
MRITVIVPLSRPELWPNVLHLFRQQTYFDKRLWVVFNGRALGATALAQGVADRLLTSRPNCAIARNTALSELRAEGGGYFALWDDDDYYGPGYLSDVASDAARAEVTGKQTHFVSYAERYLFFYYPERASRMTRAAQGGTLAGRAEDALDFPEMRRGEDLAWCEQMRAKGARIYNRGLYHYRYCLGGDAAHAHATGVQSVTSVIYRLGRGSYIGAVEDRIVDGILPVPHGRPVLPHHPFEPEVSDI